MKLSSREIVRKINQVTILQNIILFIYYAFPILIAIAYVIHIGYLYYTYQELLIAHILKPSLVLLIVCIIRNCYYRPRPFVYYDFKPLHHHKTSSSFPSKHAASTIIISLLLSTSYPNLTLILFLISSCIILTRYLAGVHYISDLIMSYLIAYFIFLL